MSMINARPFRLQNVKSQQNSKRATIPHLVKCGAEAGALTHYKGLGNGQRGGDGYIPVHSINAVMQVFTQFRVCIFYFKFTPGK